MNKIRNSLKVFFFMLCVIQIVVLIIFFSAAYNNVRLLNSDRIQVNSKQDQWLLSTEHGHNSTEISKNLIMDQNIIIKDYKTILLIELLFSIIVFVFTSISLIKFMRVYFETAKTNTPFSITNVKNIKQSSICIMIAYGFVPIIKPFLYFSIFLKSTIYFSFENILLLLTTILLFILSKVFYYGCYLQEEYDNTL
ncbi:hypothetical protein [Candidatus Ruminimicrobium bovinum]|uniref:hypothetical protein n=1 Tax=Candidatus Ruminimicrobium bovinum TaxID=3242779 RepID=UPI0039B8D994